MKDVKGRHLAKVSDTVLIVKSQLGWRWHVSRSGAAGRRGRQRPFRLTTNGKVPQAMVAMTRCGYCKRGVVSIVHLLPRAKPVCGSAACLALAYRDSERHETDDGTTPKQAA
jgi:hypothetical protein